MTAAKQRSTVVGVFQDRDRANQAVNELVNAGYRQDQIGVAMPGTEAETRRTTTEASDQSQAGSGAVAGALTGLGLGALAGLGVLAGVIPVVGPAIAGGTLGIILSNAAAGAGIAGLTGALIGAGVPEEEAEYYEGEFKAGRTIVTVTATGKADEVMAVLRRYGAYDVSQRSDLDRAASTQTRTEAACANTGDYAAAAQAYGEARGGAGEAIQLKEERLRAEKHPVATGEVSIHKDVRTETKSVEVPVQREEVIVERTPAHGRAARGAVAGDICEGEEIRVPVYEEQVEVTKEPVVAEEVRVGKRVVQDTEHVSGEVRKEELEVNRTGNVDVKNRGKDEAARKR